MLYLHYIAPPLSCSSFDSTSSVVRDSTHHATSGAHLASAWPASFLAHVVRRAPRLLEAAVGEEGRPQTVVARRVRRRLVVVEL